MVMGMAAVVGAGDASFWAGLEKVCRMAVGVRAGKAAVAELAISLLECPGAPDGLAARVASYVRTELCEAAGQEGGWLATMVRMNKLTELDLRAAREIVHVLKLRAECAAAAVPAIDPSRPAVDGGPPIGARLSGLVQDQSTRRFDAWVKAVIALPEKQRVVRGRNKSMSLTILVRRVVAEGDGPNRIDKELGIRNGRCGELVARELRRYRETNFPVAVRGS